MSDEQPSGMMFAARTAWSRNLASPLRSFLATENSGAPILLAAAVAALVWCNVDAGSYASVWSTRLAIRLGSHGISQELRQWVNDGLMVLFFFVVGLEARREFDVGELRERRRLAVPLLAGIAGMAVPVGIFLAFNAGRASAAGWGAAMSTDTALALGMLTLVGPRVSGRLRAFMLTVAVVDDLTALVVIATVYTHHVALGALALAAGVFVFVLAVRALGVHSGLVYAALGALMWVATYESGVDPLIVGLLMGLLTYAYPAARSSLERATERFRSFREQPTPELARSAALALESAISPNDRLAQRFHPWSSYVVVPLFALANIGIAINGPLLRRAFSSPITLGILVGYVAGKPIGVAGTARLLSWLSRGRLRLPVGWAAVIGGGAIAGIGFTVSLLIATIAFSGEQLAEAKVGILSAAIAASASTWLIFRAVDLLPGRGARARWRAGSKRSSTWRSRSTRSAITSADRPMHRSRCSNTATSNARSATRPSRCCVNYSPTSATCATSGGTCRSATYTRRRSWPPRRPRQPAPRARSGRCMTSCSPIRTRCDRPISSATPPSSAWTESASRAIYAATRAHRALPTTSTAQTSAASRARPRSSSTAAATTAPTTSTRCRPRSAWPTPKPSRVKPR